MMMFPVESPKSGFVAKRVVADKAAVVKDQTLAEMDGAEERLRLLQLDIMKRTLEAAEQRLSGGNFDLVKAVAAIRVEAAEVNQKYRSAAVHARRDDAQVGQASPSDVAIAEAAELVGNYEMERATVDADRLEDTASDVQEYIRRFKELIDAEVIVIRKRISRLKVLAPHDGIVRWYVFEGGYVSAGTIVATITES